MGTKSRSIFCILAIAMFAMMLVGVASAGIHGPSPPTIDIVSASTGYQYAIGNTNSMGIVGRASCATAPTGAISSNVAALSTEGTDSMCANDAIYDYVGNGVAIGATTNCTVEGRRSHHVGKVYATIPEPGNGDYVGDRM